MMIRRLEAPNFRTPKVFLGSGIYHNSTLGLTQSATLPPFAHRRRFPVIAFRTPVTNEPLLSRLVPSKLTKNETIYSQQPCSPSTPASSVLSVIGASRQLGGSCQPSLFIIGEPGS